jgi:hypothetical protein
MKQHRILSLVLAITLILSLFAGYAIGHEALRLMTSQPIKPSAKAPSQKKSWRCRSEAMLSLSHLQVRQRFKVSQFLYLGLTVLN